jgi:hypothetical protein
MKLLTKNYQHLIFHTYNKILLKQIKLLITLFANYYFQIY